MAENVGSGESEFGSVTSSQISFLNNCPFAGVEEDTDSDGTEVLGTPISPPLTRTPILSLSTPISLDSINDEDVFRTPPENASLSSSAAESEPRARASEIKRGGSKSNSPSRVSASPSLTAETVRVLEMNRVSDRKESVTEVTPLSPPSSLAAGDVRVPGKHSDLDSPSPESATEGIKVTESGGGDDYEIEIPFKEVIEALLRNNGENLDERDERVSYVDILKRYGLKFP
ncbi:hypothetical protein F2Q68_00027392 [Brassica cretica]|uniref:Uncharacterized protein n=1 Tax=Brassica cretica TaxID=69181 RepID=A0A8S9IDU8_BRACR|nr:hypothetical protein F2Q68_00027392 [Brassica cretica]